MARTRNATVHAVRRDAFVDAAQRLIQAKGYEGMSIQDVLDELGASRGAFYHYFGSKADLLEAVVERLTDAATGALLPIVDDPDLSATKKLDSFFTGLARWKGERTDLLRGLIDTWLTDDNAIVREKFRQRIVASAHADPRTDRRPGTGRGLAGDRRARACRARPRVGHPGCQRDGHRAVLRPPGRHDPVRRGRAEAGRLLAGHGTDARPARLGRSRRSIARRCASGTADGRTERRPHDRDHPDREAHQVVRRAPRHHRRRPRGRRGRGVRLPRSQRRRQDDDDPDRARPDPPDERAGARLRDRLERGSGGDPPARRLHPGRVHAVRPADRAARPSSTSPTCAAGSTRPTRRR